MTNSIPFKTLSLLILLLIASSLPVKSQINTDRVLSIGKNALYYEDYVLSIQYFNQVIRSKPYLAEPYFYRGLAKFYLDDYSGSERDLTSCIERNPFLWMSYQVRGACRQNLGNFEGAIDDYNKGMEFRPEDRHFLFNKGIAMAQLKRYDEAIESFDQLIRYQPRFIQAHLTKGAVCEEKGDTLAALDNYNRALELDKYYAPAYERRAMLYFQQEKYDQALIDIDEAIRLETQPVGYHVNRGLIRFYLNDLRGAMADYDRVIQLDEDNLIARFNRGILRASVGDSYAALEDFDKVVESEPDNFMAIYNRVILNYELKRYSNCLNDLNQVLVEYPNFLQGYYFRSELKRQMNDLRGAERDYKEAQSLEKQLNSLQAQGKVITGKEIKEPGEATEISDGKVRESSDRDIAKFNRLVVYDKEEETRSQYQNEIRGRVQDRQVKVDMEPQFVITYYEPLKAIDKSAARSTKLLTDFNNKKYLPMQLRVTNEEMPLSDIQAEEHFASINTMSLSLNKNPDNEIALFSRGLDYMILQDFTEAIDNFSQAIEADPDFVLPYFNRAVTRYKQIEVDDANKGTSLTTELTLISDSKPVMGQLIASPKLNQEPVENNPLFRYDVIIRDYDKVISLSPDFFYAYFNRGNVRCLQKDYRAAIKDYSEAILINADFAEAYFNRGLTQLYLGDTQKGIEDLSKAGELGMVNAYGIIKKMTE